MEAEGRAVALLGSQKIDFDFARVLKKLGVKKHVALITAGWQEREVDDSLLVAELKARGITAMNLRLHFRSEDVFKMDEELAAAYSARQNRLRDLQNFYRVRLDYTGEAARAISVRHVDAELLEQESRVSVEQFRHIDRDHVERCRAIHVEFDERVRMKERRVVSRHIAELQKLLESAEAVVIAGGHVASLLNRLKLFDIASIAGARHIVAWGAGAMALTERIVLFHDFPPYGSVIAQVLDSGLALAPGIVVLPDPRRRIRVDDREGIARFAQRMAPATCVALDRQERVILRARRIETAFAERLTTDGLVESGWNGAPS